MEKVITCAENKWSWTYFSQRSVKLLTNRRGVRIIRFLFVFVLFFYRHVRCTVHCCSSATLARPRNRLRRTTKNSQQGVRTYILYTQPTPRRVIKTLKVNWNSVDSMKMDSWRRCVGRSRRGRKRNLHRQADIARDTATVGSLHDGVGGRRDRVTFLGAKQDRCLSSHLGWDLVLVEEETV